MIIVIEDVKAHVKLQRILVLIVATVSIVNHLAIYGLQTEGLHIIFQHVAMGNCWEK